MIIKIDPNSGFCFGVVFAIKAAEEELEKSGNLYCVGDIVHNNREVERLTGKGLKIIDHNQLINLRNCKVMIRAHGEPPETYRIALENNIELIDASCPVVLKLQNNIRKGFEQTTERQGQIVIFGKEGHAEVNGLVGQTGGKAIIVSGEKDLDKIDYQHDVFLYSQTTMSTDGFKTIVDEIRRRLKETGAVVNFFPDNTICRQVSCRAPQVRKFAAQYDVIIFVSDTKSSNGTFLFGICKSVNPSSYFISIKEDIKREWFYGAHSIGISGATSTPHWVMEEVLSAIKNIAD